MRQHACQLVTQVVRGSERLARQTGPCGIRHSVQAAVLRPICHDLARLRRPAQALHTWSSHARESARDEPTLMTRNVVAGVIATLLLVSISVATQLFLREGDSIIAEARSEATMSG